MHNPSHTETLAGFEREINPGFEKLLEVYKELHFIYPAKTAKLEPLMDRVRRSWRSALKLHFPQFSTTVVKSVCSPATATVTVWRCLNRGMIGQHLASNHPLASREVLLSVLDDVISMQDECSIDSFQIYYRPDNKYPSRMFRMASEAAGAAYSILQPYDYFQLPPVRYTSGELDVVRADAGNRSEWLGFLRNCRPDVFIKGQELDTEDFGLNELDTELAKRHLYRRRKIFFARNRADRHVCGVVIQNTAPIGLNFSLLENAIEMVLDPHACDAQLEETAKSLLGAIESPNSLIDGGGHYALTDPYHRAIFGKLSGQWIRNYHLFMILKGGYENWYESVKELTQAVYVRCLENKMAK